MSVRIMSKVFESDSLTPTEKLIMLALADHADDAGVCYPSIERLCQRTGLKERAVQSNIRALTERGFITVFRNAGPRGSNRYLVTPDPAADAPRIKCTPAADAPRPRIKCTPDPAADAPETSVTINEPSERARDASEILADVASESVAKEFIAHRAEMKKPLTTRAAKAMAKRLGNHKNPDAVLMLSIENGWQGVFPEKVGAGKKGSGGNQNAGAFGILKEVG